MTGTSCLEPLDWVWTPPSPGRVHCHDHLVTSAVAQQGRVAACPHAHCRCPSPPTQKGACPESHTPQLALSKERGTWECPLRPGWELSCQQDQTPDSQLSPPQGPSCSKKHLKCPKTRPCHKLCFYQQFPVGNRVSHCQLRHRVQGLKSETPSSRLKVSLSLQGDFVWKSQWRRSPGGLWGSKDTTGCGGRDSCCSRITLGRGRSLQWGTSPGLMGACVVETVGSAARPGGTTRDFRSEGLKQASRRESGLRNPVLTAQREGRRPCAVPVLPPLGEAPALWRGHSYRGVCQDFFGYK